MFQIVAQDVSKYYRIYKKPVDRLIEALVRRPRHRMFTALKDVTFEVEPGISLGIIGDNGAGKSTLLKLLAGTLTPSGGRIEVNGLVSALLELGAGFHTEFTGRQNIGISCGLMGISAENIKRLEKEIISFSGLDDFIDRPVKTYSSGMYVRLGFAIATSVNPDILVIDEALAVGDLKFQRKCIDRMGSFRDRGKTMIFCSHSMYHVQEICDRVLWIDKGHVKKIGIPGEVIGEYEDFCRARRPATIDEKKNILDLILSESEVKECYISYLSLETPGGAPSETIKPFTDVVMRMEVEILIDGVRPQFAFALMMSDQSVFSASVTHHDKIECGPYNAGQKVDVRLHIKNIPIRSGCYILKAGVANDKGLLWYDIKDTEPIFAVSEEKNGVGLVALQREWEVRCG